MWVKINMHLIYHHYFLLPENWYRRILTESWVIRVHHPLSVLKAWGILPLWRLQLAFPTRIPMTHPQWSPCSGSHFHSPACPARLPDTCAPLLATSVQILTTPPSGKKTYTKFGVPNQNLTPPDPQVLWRLHDSSAGQKSVLWEWACHFGFFGSNWNPPRSSVMCGLIWSYW